MGRFKQVVRPDLAMEPTFSGQAAELLSVPGHDVVWRRR